MSEIFSGYAKHYDLLYKDKDYKTEAAYFHGLISKWSLFDVEEVLEFGAGTGKHQLEFNELGLSSVGVDFSSEMVAIAQQEGRNVVLGDIRHYRHPERVGVIVALFHVVSYMASDEDLDLALSNVRINLIPGGLFIFDVWFTEAVQAQNPEVRVKRVCAPELELVRISEPEVDRNSNVVRVNFTLFSKITGDEFWMAAHERHEMRHFSLPDLHFLAHKHDFEIVGVEETLTGASPSPSSWGVTVIARAKRG